MDCRRKLLCKESASLYKQECVCVRVHAPVRMQGIMQRSDSIACQERFLGALNGALLFEVHAPTVAAEVLALSILQ